MRQQPRTMVPKSIFGNKLKINKDIFDILKHNGIKKQQPLPKVSMEDKGVWQSPLYFKGYMATSCISEKGPLTLQWVFVGWKKHGGYLPSERGWRCWERQIWICPRCILNFLQHQQLFYLSHHISANNPVLFHPVSRPKRYVNSYQTPNPKQTHQQIYRT